jgi:hypothetical protein
MRRTYLSLIVPLLLTVATPSFSGAAEPVFVFRDVDGKEFRGPLIKLGADWSVEIGKANGRTIAGNDFLSLRQKDAILPPLPSDEHLVLANGDRVPFQDLRLDDEKLTFRNKDLGGETKLTVGLSAVVVIWRMATDREAEPEIFRRRLLSAKRTRDRVLLRNGDTIEGTLQSLGAERVEVEVNKKTVSALWKQVAAIALSTELADSLRPKGIHARLVLTEPPGAPGGRITLTKAVVHGAKLLGKTVFGADIRVPVERIAHLEILGGKATALEEIAPSKYEYRAYLGEEKWPWTTNSNVMGRDIQLAGSTYDRGIGMHSHALLEYPLDGKYRRFEALVGMDERDGRYGKVRIKVLLDGKPADLGKKGQLDHAGGPLVVNVSVEGAKTLTLDVENAENGPVQGVVNWVEARLVK